MTCGFHMDQGFYSAQHRRGRLSPLPALHGLPVTGTNTGLLDLPGEQGHRLLVPQTARSSEMLPLIIALHGAGGQDGGLNAIALRWAAARGALVIVPQSAASSWDVLRGGYGPDIAEIDRLIQWTGIHYALDPARVTLAGFSDGASYALSVGLSNGSLFRDIFAFSPGFALSRPQGRPRVFISHGTHDIVLPVTCGRGLAERLSAGGYNVTYKEFAGGHMADEDSALEALDRFGAPSFSHPASTDVASST